MARSRRPYCLLRQVQFAPCRAPDAQEDAGNEEGIERGVGFDLVDRVVPKEDVHAGVLGQAVVEVMTAEKARQIGRKGPQGGYEHQEGRPDEGPDRRPHAANEIEGKQQQGDGQTQSEMVHGDFSFRRAPFQ